MHLLVIALVMLVVAYVLQAVLVKRPKQKPAAMDEFDFPQWDEGTPQMVPFGDIWTDEACVVWWGHYRTKKVKSGGKK